MLYYFRAEGCSSFHGIKAILYFKGSYRRVQDSVELCKLMSD